jgi:hypothetical protein
MKLIVLLFFIILSSIEISAQERKTNTGQPAVESREEMASDQNVMNRHNCLVYVDTKPEGNDKNEAVHVLNVASKQACLQSAEAFKITANPNVKTARVSALWLGDPK